MSEKKNQYNYIIKGTVIKSKVDKSPDDLVHSALFIKDIFHYLMLLKEQLAHLLHLFPGYPN